MANETLTSDDPRYSELFDVRKEAAAVGHVYGDLTPQFNALRERCSVHQGSLRQILNLPAVHQAYDRPRDHYSIFSFKLCDQALRQNEVFSSKVYEESPGVQSMGKVILKMTGEEHRRYRGAVQPMFIKPQAINWWRPNWIEGAVDALLNKLEGQERADLNQDLCARLPVNVVTQGMGMKGENALAFRDHLQKSTVSARHLPPDVVQASRAEVSRMLKDVITARRREPGDDVISGLIAAELVESDGSVRYMDDEEVFAYCRLIMLAGGGTTWRQLGITIHALLSNYSYWEALRDDRDLIPGAIEEAARWMPTDPIFARLLMQDVELEGVKISAGTRIDMVLGAANRDPTRWDNPDVYDPFRPYQPHLGFGMGPHRCLGLEVAKQEMLVALNGLMERFPDLCLDSDAPRAELLGGLEQRGMSAVPVCLR